MAKPGKKAPASGCWFDKLTTTELSELLKACGESRGGAKADLVARLSRHAAAAEYSAEARAPVLSRTTCEFVGGRDGLSVDDIKRRCRERGLKVSGTRFQLVLSLLSAPPAAAGAPPVAPRAPRAPSKKPADTARLVARLRAKIGANFTSGSKWKQHAIVVLSDLTSMLCKEAHDKGRLDACDPALADAALALLTELHSGWHKVSGQGYLSDYAGEFSEVVNDIVDDDGLRAVTPPETRAALLHVRGMLAVDFREYGVCVNLASADSDDDDDDDVY